MNKVLCLIALVAVFGAVVSAQSNDVQACATDIENILSFAPQFIKDIRAKKPLPIILDALKAVKIADSTKKNCHGKDWIKAMEIAHVQNPFLCFQDVLKVVPKVESLVGDIKKGKILNILNDIHDIIPQVETAIIDCKNIKQGAKAEFNFIETPINNPECQSDLTQLLLEVGQLVKDVTNMAILEVPSDLTRVLNALKAAAHDCTSSIDITPFLNMTTVTPVLECAQNAGNVLHQLQSIQKHISSKKFDKVLMTILELIPQVKEYAGECKNTFAHFKPQQVFNFFQTQECSDNLFQLIMAAQQLLNAGLSFDFVTYNEVAPQLVLAAKNTLNACGKGL